MPEIFIYAFNTFLAIFVIIDPFSMVPIFLTLTERFQKNEKDSIRNKSTLIALCTLMVFAFTGMSVFNFFGITLPAFQIAGGILLLLMGIDQLRATSKRVNSEETDEGLHKNTFRFSDGNASARRSRRNLDRCASRRTGRHGESPSRACLGAGCSDCCDVACLKVVTLFVPGAW